MNYRRGRKRIEEESLHRKKLEIKRNAKEGENEQK